MPTKSGCSRSAHRGGQNNLPTARSQQEFHLSSTTQFRGHFLDLRTRVCCSFGGCARVTGNPEVNGGAFQLPVGRPFAQNLIFRSPQHHFWTRRAHICLLVCKGRYTTFKGLLRYRGRAGERFPSFPQSFAVRDLGSRVHRFSFGRCSQIAGSRRRKLAALRQKMSRFCSSVTKSADSMPAMAIPMASGHTT